MQTTLSAIRKHSPCSSGWAKLLKTLNKTQADNEPLEFSVILTSNGLADAIWCLRALDGKDKEIRKFAIFCARQNYHLLTDERSRKAIEVAEAFVNSDASEDELKAAYAAANAAAAYSAAYTTANAAVYAADAAAYAAAYAADAAYAAAYAAVYAADAAYAARKEQEVYFKELFC